MEVLSRATSDHSPLVLKASFQMHSGPRRFRFQNMWIKRPDFLDVVKRCWSESQQGYGMYLFSCKLRNLKQSLRIWNRDKFGNVFRNVKEAEDRVKQLESQFDQTGLDSDLLVLKEAQALLLRSMAEEEAFWRQKARLKWAQDGDHNTKLFHTSVAIKHAKLSIARI